MDIKQRLKTEIQSTLQPHVTALTRDELRELVFQPALAEIERMERCVDAARTRLRLADIELSEAQTRLALVDEELKSALIHEPGIHPSNR
jgi:hypothetical protein